MSSKSSNSTIIVIGVILIIIQLFVSCLSSTAPDIGSMDWGPELSLYNLVYLIGYNFLLVIGVVFIF